MKRYSWLVLWVVAALLVAACGPSMVTPTPDEGVTVGNTETAAPTQESPAETAPEATQEEGPEPPPERLVSEDDWRVLGSPEAPVTIVEYSDFQ